MSPTAITLTDRLQLLNFYAKKIRERGKRRREAKGSERKSRGEGERKRQKGGGKKDLIHVSFCGCPWIEPTSASATDGNREQQGGGEAIGHLHKNRGPWSTEEMLIYSNGSSVIPDHSITQQAEIWDWLSPAFHSESGKVASQTSAKWPPVSLHLRNSTPCFLPLAW